MSQGKSNTLNIARTVRAYQLADYSVKTPAVLAIDGNFTTISCTTMSNPKPWWAVELAIPAAVAGVNVTNDRNTGFRKYHTFVFLLYL